MLRAADIAREMQVTTKTVRRWIASGELRAVRIGGVVRVPVRELERIKGERK